MNQRKPFIKDQYACIKSGWETIGDQRFYSRSGYETDVACWLEYQRKKGEIDLWCHEPFRIDFPIARSKGYIVDFVCYKIIDGEKRIVRMIEVKGQIKKSDFTKIKRLKKYYPEYFKVFCYVCNGSYIDVIRHELKVNHVVDIKEIKNYQSFFRSQIGYKPT